MEEEKAKEKGIGKDAGGVPPTLRCKWNEQILEEGCLEVAQIGELLEWEASDNGIAFITAEEFYQGFPHEPMSGPKAALLPITWEKALAFGGLEEGEMKEKMKKCADFICRFGVRITVPTRDPRSNEVFPKETVMISVARTKTEWTGEAATHSCENKVAHKPIIDIVMESKMEWHENSSGNWKLMLREARISSAKRLTRSMGTRKRRRLQASIVRSRRKRGTSRWGSKPQQKDTKSTYTRPTCTSAR